MQDRGLLDSIRSEVQEAIGKRVVLRADRGRKRIIVKEGVITDAFEDVFTVTVVNEFDIPRTMSYTYIDILTEAVTLTIC